jgi:hypothetical protein
MRNTIKECKALGIKVKIPKVAKKDWTERGFVHLKGEPDHTPHKLQNKNFRHISKSTFIYIVNPEGYIGSSTAMELGYALHANIPIYASHKPRDFIFTFYVKSGKSLQQIREILTGHV